MSETNAKPVESFWKDMTNRELALSNLTFHITGLLDEINSGNPINDSLKRPIRPKNIEKGSMDDNDWEKLETEYRDLKLEARTFSDGNEDRIAKLRNKLDALEDEKNVVEKGGKNQDELIERYATAERERREKLKKKSKPKTDKLV